MFKKDKDNSNIRIRIEVKKNWCYPAVFRSVYEAISRWSKDVDWPIYALCIDLLITDDILLASQEWDGTKTIIYLNDGNVMIEVKDGILVSDGTNIYHLIRMLLQNI